MIESSIFKELKNSQNEKAALNYELTRMQHIDRLKVAHVKDSFYNPNHKSLLPSLETAIANSGLSSTPQPLMMNPNSLLSTSNDYVSQLSLTDVITTNELKGHCERLNQQPS